MWKDVTGATIVELALKGVLSFALVMSMLILFDRASKYFFVTYRITEANLVVYNLLVIPVFKIALKNIRGATVITRREALALGFTLQFPNHFFPSTFVKIQSAKFPRVSLISPNEPAQFVEKLLRAAAKAAGQP